MIRKEGKQTVKLVQAIGGQAAYSHVNVASAADSAKLVKFAERNFGKLNILFINAVITHQSNDNALTTEEAIWDLTMNINAKGVFFGCKFGIPALRCADRDSIINKASLVALLGAATPQVAYTASKGALLSMTRELAVIHARESIRVNSLCPGAVAH
jgi:NAD(P)-dependent dehydrogenase (short-subunit alcohol dehydrogenase family)